MASAGLLKILVSGLQDERLLPPKGQPRLDAFQKAFVKAGRFTTEIYRVEFDNQPAFGTTARVTIPRRGHLVTRAYLVTVMPDIATAQQQARSYCESKGLSFAGPTFGWTNSVGHALVTSANLTIGANSIDTLDGRLLEVMDEFHTPLEKVTTLNRMLGRVDTGFTPQTNGSTGGSQTVVTPLPFWFARGDPSVALPIDAMGNEIVQAGIEFKNVDSLYTSTSRSKTLNAYELGDPNALSTITTAIPYTATTATKCGTAKYSGVDIMKSTRKPTPNFGYSMYPPMASSPFYFIDPNGQEVFGLNGNADKSTRVTQIPGITMPPSFQIQESYMLFEYVYIDQPEANRIRLADISYPIVQHYPFTQDTKGAPNTKIQMRIPNPCRNIYFTVHRNDAELLNAPFLATRDLSGTFVADASGIGPIAPWWPDAQGLSTSSTNRYLVPAYSTIDSEPITSLSFNYDGKIVRYATDSPAFFRSILPSLEMRKSPWMHKYYYTLPFSTSSEDFGVGLLAGHANLDKILKVELSLTFKPFRGSTRVTDVPGYTVYVWAETYNILKVYGGRAGLLFNY